LATTAAVPRVSVIITTFESARFLGATLESVLAQTGVELECLVVDDASTDGTREVLSKVHDERVRVLSNAHNLGPYASANRALEVSRGDFIARLDADDVCLPGRLQRQLAFFDAHPGVGVLGGACVRIDESGDVLGLQSVPESDLAVRLRCLVSPPFVHSTVMWRRALGLRYDGTMRLAGDYELWTRALEVTRAANLAEPLVHYRVWTGGISSRHRALQRSLHDTIAAAWCARQWPSLGLEAAAFSALRDWCGRSGEPPLPPAAHRLVSALREAVLGPAPSPAALETFARAMFSAPGTYGQPTPAA
jgi:glycosyltransferase involved in cell wall biosynthesis